MRLTNGDEPDNDTSFSECYCRKTEPDDAKQTVCPDDIFEREDEIGQTDPPLLRGECTRKSGINVNLNEPQAIAKSAYRPVSGRTNLRPVVDRYSLTRYAPSDWRARNSSLLIMSHEKTSHSQQAAADAKSLVARIFKETDKAQEDSLKNLQDCIGIINDYKKELEIAIKRMTDEINDAESDKRRLKMTLSVLAIIESITSEFLEIRSTRLEPDLVFDDVEDELVKERALCRDIRDVFNMAREHLEKQLIELRAAKDQMEMNWSDKCDAFRIDLKCTRLNMVHPEIIFKPGATKIPENQTTAAVYVNHTNGILQSAECARQDSINLRSNLNAIYTNSLKDLHDQATRIDIALDGKIKLTEQVLYQLECELTRVLRDLASTEKLIDDLRTNFLGLDRALKLAQTRLDSRLLRPNIEQCLDAAQISLIEEVKMNGERSSALKDEIKRIREVEANLIKAKCELERDIMVKRKSLYVDKFRGRTLRSHYPSTAALTGIE
ncbi:tektin-4 [Prorops nasuta]|uniref:tektin-4 n=1 Tax=Prorops nasuta TaxID=863751 RepID=UPI0034CF209A